MQGFYVNIDYHSNNYTNQIAGGDGSIFDKQTWTQTWVYLQETIVNSVPQAQGKLLIDLINEPDGCACTPCLLQPSAGPGSTCRLHSRYRKHMPVHGDEFAGLLCMSSTL